MLQAESSKYSKIRQTVVDLEHPISNDRIDELNFQLQDYLEHVGEPLNLSFWQTVNFEYWSFNNVTKLLKLKFDVEYGESLKAFEEKLRQVQRRRMQNHSPRFSVKLPPVIAKKYEPVPTKKEPEPEPSHESPSKFHVPVNTTKGNIDEIAPKNLEDTYLVPKLIGGGCLAVLAAWFVFHCYSKTNA